MATVGCFPYKENFRQFTASVGVAKDMMYSWTIFGKRISGKNITEQSEVKI